MEIRIARMPANFKTEGDILREKYRTMPEDDLLSAYTDWGAMGKEKDCSEEEWDILTAEVERRRVPEALYFVIDDDWAPTMTQGDEFRNFNDAFKTFAAINEERPCYMFAVKEYNGVCYLYDTTGKSDPEKWQEISRVYFAARENPGTSYPETTIVRDGIFARISDAIRFANENPATRWKLYTFGGLVDKLTESANIRKQLLESNSEIPF